MSFFVLICCGSGYLVYSHDLTKFRSITFDDKIRIIDMAELQADGAGMRNLEPKNYSQRWNLFNKSNAFQRFKSERSKWFKDDPNKFLDPRKGEVVSRS